MPDVNTVALDIHKALHSDASEVLVFGQNLSILQAPSGQRYVTCHGQTFITIDPERPGRLAHLAANGNQVTRIMRPGKKWSAIINGRHVNKQKD